MKENKYEKNNFPDDLLRDWDKNEEADSRKGREREWKSSELFCSAR